MTEEKLFELKQIVTRASFFNHDFEKHSKIAFINKKKELQSCAYTAKVVSIETEGCQMKSANFKVLAKHMFSRKLKKM